MYSILSELNALTIELERSGHMQEANALHNAFVRVATSATNSDTPLKTNSHTKPSQNGLLQPFTK